MPNGKIMTDRQMTGEAAVRYLTACVIPQNWVVRPMNPDFGIDLDVDLFDYEGDRCITLGEHLYLQVKGTNTPQYDQVKLNNAKIDVVKYSLEIPELNLVERRGSAFPVLLVLVDLKNKKVYQICLNDYIRKVLPVQNPHYKRQGSVTIYIPIKNEISSENIDALKWYGKRIKLYSMFHEMLVDIEDIGYIRNKLEYVQFGKQFIERYRENDCMYIGEYWTLISQIKEKMDHLYDNDYLFVEAIHMIQHTLGYEDDWEKGIVYENFEEETNAKIATQRMSISMLMEFIKTSCGCFETYCREWFMSGLILGVNNFFD